MRPLRLTCHTCNGEGWYTTDTGVVIDPCDTCDGQGYFEVIPIGND